MRHRDKRFLSWAKQQGGYCCRCWEVHLEETPATDLHHFGASGMGLKGSDYKVARLCRECHGIVQGKSRVGFERLGRLNEWICMLEDGLGLLGDWAGR